MIKLFTDTSANLPLNLIIENDITIVPFSYSIDGIEADYSEKSDFDGKAFYDAMREGAVVNTSMVNPGTFIEAFSKELEAGNDVLYVGMSGGISGTAHSAAVAVEKLRAVYSDAKIAAIDTLAASLGEGLLVLEAAARIAEGMSFEEVEDRILTLRDFMCQYFMVDDLEYLKRGGRISGTAAILGSILNIKPILTGNSAGKIVMDGKSRGRKRALATLADKYAELVLDKKADIGIAHADSESDVEYLIDLLREHGFEGKCLKVYYEPVTGSHVGPGTIALFFQGKYKKD
ncbi:MAG: DegV family protein [Clostridiales bacterium]|jgi:DegV family protein with EDD domain|nr:DegV family protein [Clostridiales bacterium]